MEAGGLLKSRTSAHSVVAVLVAALPFDTEVETGQASE